MSAESVASSDHTLPGPDAGARYTPHRPEQTLLHRTIREQLEGFLARSAERGHPVPRFVEQELRAFLRCGVLAHGFLRLRCDDCGCDRLVPFSCKRRGFCPACGGRRMADTAAHLADRVLPEVPIRQWVLTLPYPLRYRCAYDAKLASEVLRAFVRALFAELRRRSRQHWGVRAQQCGAVTFIQRFGSAMNLNLHFHTLALDGVYADAGDPRAAPRFLPLPPLGDDDLARVLAGTARRLERLVAERAGADEDALARDEPLLAVLAAASLRGRSTSGTNAGERWRRLGDRIEPADDNAEPEASPRVPQHGGMSLHAAVAVPARDRRRLERLCRYVARPPLANDRLEELPDGRLAVRLKTPWRDRTSHILMERSELIERLVPLIPPPRAHQVRYHGILAPCASWRYRVVPAGNAALAAAAGERATEPHGPTEPPPSADLRGEPTALGEGAPGVESSGARNESRPPGARGAAPGVDPRDTARNGGIRSRHRWAELLQRVFGVEALRCPRCGSTMRVIAAIEDPGVARKILECLNLPARAPPLEPAAADIPNLGQAEDDRLFDQSPVHDEP
jgi:hypothetical protein